MINNNTGLGGSYTIGNGKTTPNKTETHNNKPEIISEKTPPKKPKSEKVASRIVPSHSDKHQEQLRQAAIRFAQAPENNNLGQDKGLLNKSSFSLPKR